MAVTAAKMSALIPKRLNVWRIPSTHRFVESCGRSPQSFCEVALVGLVHVFKIRGGPGQSGSASEPSSIDTSGTLRRGSEFRTPSSCPPRCAPYVGGSRISRNKHWSL